MAEKEVFQALRDVADALEKEMSDLDCDDMESANLHGNLYSYLASLSDLLTRVKDCKKPKDEDKDQTVVTAESITEMAALASAFDKSGDELLMKQAAVLDEILLTIGANKRQVAEAKSAQDREVDRIKSFSAKEDGEDPYTMVKAEHDKQLKVEDVRKEIANKVKEYRPLEAPLMTRTCPDHPGAQMARIAEHTYQCSLDKAVYNYQNGFTTMKGNKIPGSSIMNQTQDHDKPNEFTSFDSRESRLNK